MMTLLNTFFFISGKSIFNAAPASSSLNPLLFTLPDIFCVNETEAEILTNIKVTSTKEAEEAVAKLISKGCKEVIVTLGEKGAVYGKKGCTEFEIIKALKVNAIDTTVSILLQRLLFVLFSWVKYFSDFTGSRRCIRRSFGILFV